MSCSENYEQSFKNFTEYNQANLRQKGWFPDIISADCYDMKEIHNLDNNNCYGKFSYHQDSIEMKVLGTKKFTKSTFDRYTHFVAKLSYPEKPSWFLTNINSNNMDVYESKNIFIVNNREIKTVYFTYSTEFQ